MRGVIVSIMVNIEATLPIPIEIIDTVTQKIIGMVIPNINSILVNCLENGLALTSNRLQIIASGSETVIEGIIFTSVFPDSRNNCPLEEI